MRKLGVLEDSPLGEFAHGGEQRSEAISKLIYEVMGILKIYLKNNGSYHSICENNGNATVERKRLMMQEIGD